MGQGRVKNKGRELIQKSRGQKDGGKCRRIGKETKMRKRMKEITKRECEGG